MGVGLKVSHYTKDLRKGILELEMTGVGLKVSRYMRYLREGMLEIIGPESYEGLCSPS